MANALIYVRICCPWVQSGIQVTDGENLLPGHRGTMEEQGVRREGCVQPHIQDPHHAAQLLAPQGCVA